MNNLKITPILIVCFIGVVISFFCVIIYLPKSGGESLVALPFIMLLGISILIGFLERLIVNLITKRSKKIWIVEIILMIVISIGIFISVEGRLYLTVDNRVEWVAVFIGNCTSNRIIEYSFPNNNTLKIEKNDVSFVNQHEIGNKKIDINTDKKNLRSYILWGKSISIHGKEFEYSMITFGEYNPTDSLLNYIENKIKKTIK
jgi:hypothetical protein